MDTAIRNNTERREAPPDVDDYPGPFKERCLALVERLGTGALTLEAYQRAVAALFADSTLPDLLGFQSWTFDPIAPTRHLGRQMLDPTCGVQEDGLIVAREIGLASGIDAGENLHVCVPAPCRVAQARRSVRGRRWPAKV